MSDLSRSPPYLRKHACNIHGCVQSKGCLDDLARRCGGFRTVVISLVCCLEVCNYLDFGSSSWYQPVAPLLHIWMQMALLEHCRCSWSSSPPRRALHLIAAHPHTRNPGDRPRILLCTCTVFNIIDSLTLPLRTAAATATHHHHHHHCHPTLI
jgi:hypothetical protein